MAIGPATVSSDVAWLVIGVHHTVVVDNDLALLGFCKATTEIEVILVILQGGLQSAPVLLSIFAP